MRRELACKGVIMKTLRTTQKISLQTLQDGQGPQNSCQDNTLIVGSGPEGTVIATDEVTMQTKIERTYEKAVMSQSTRVPAEVWIGYSRPAEVEETKVLFVHTYEYHKLCRRCGRVERYETSQSGGATIAFCKDCEATLV